MENSLHSGGILQRNKKLETFLLVIGFGLFVFFGMRGLQKINNKAVAAGEAYRNALVQSAVSQPTKESGAVLAETADLKTEPQTTVPETTNKKHPHIDNNASDNSDRHQDLPARVSAEASKVKSNIKSTN